MVDSAIHQEELRIKRLVKMIEFSVRAEEIRTELHKVCVE